MVLIRLAVDDDEDNEDPNPGSGEGLEALSRDLNFLNAIEVMISTFSLKDFFISKYLVQLLTAGNVKNFSVATVL